MSFWRLRQNRLPRLASKVARQDRIEALTRPKTRAGALRGSSPRPGGSYIIDTTPENTTPKTIYLLGGGLAGGVWITTPAARRDALSQARLTFSARGPFGPSLSSKVTA